jgi:hypothetical protein
MHKQASISEKMRPSVQWPGVALLLATLIILFGCATKSNDSAGPAPREDLADYRQVASDAQKVVQTTLASLDQTTAQIPCSPKQLKAFSKDVQRLEVDSFKIRSRAQAICARGQAYFEQWQEHLRRVNDPVARRLAEDHAEHLRERFANIRVITQEARNAFKPFLAGLHRVRNALENDPAGASTEPMKDVIRATRESGKKVETSLDAILGELDAVAAMLKPNNTVRKD